jgi:hypothetical protein
MAEERLRPFKWLGPGVLHLTSGAAVQIVAPGESVERPEQLALLGAARIAALVQEKLAVPLSEKAEPVGDAISEAEKTEAQTIVKRSLEASEGLKKMGESASRRAKLQGREEAERKLPDMPVAGPTRS